MDIQLEKKPWYVRFRYYIAAGIVLLGLMGYSIAVALGPKRIRISSENVTIASVEEGKFMEYVDVEGIVMPILTIKINADEAGTVDRIVAEEGAFLHAGDTILVLKNPELMRTISDEQDEWERQQRLYREQEIEMQQKSITLHQQTLDAIYEMNNLDNKLRIEREEYEMGMKSRAELDLAEEEYKYKKQKTALQMENLRHDSTATLLKQELLRADIERSNKKLSRANLRRNGLVITAPIDGQLSYLDAVPGQHISTGASIGEIKVLSDFKLRATLNEYYIDKISAGLPAFIIQQQEKYPLRVSRVVPEVKDRSFKTDLVFIGEKPSNNRIGKSYRVQIELGQPESAIVIPRGDFYNKTNGKWIYKLTPDCSKAVKTEISIGRQNPRQYEVLSGLYPQEKVIVSGYDRLGDSEEIILQ